MMEQTIIEVLKHQRNEALDTIALVNAHLQVERERAEAAGNRAQAAEKRVAELEAQLATAEPEKADEPS